MSEHDRHATHEAARQARAADMIILRNAVRARTTYAQLARTCGKSASAVGYAMRGDYPYRYANYLPKYLRVALEAAGFSVPASLVTW